MPTSLATSYFFLSEKDPSAGPSQLVLQSSSQCVPVTLHGMAMDKHYVLSSPGMITCDQGMIFPFRELLAMSGYILGYHKFGEWGVPEECYWHLVEEARDAAI